MRLKFFAAMIAMLPMPALADVTVQYSSGKDAAVVIEADDGGDSRLTIAGKGGIIHRDGVDYLFAVTPQGEARVTELKDFITVMSGVIGQSKPVPGAETMQFVIIPKGEATVAGRKGAAFLFGPAKRADGGKEEKQIEAVLSSDPALAPIGEVFRRTLTSTLPILAVALPESSGFARLATELAGKGTPLRLAPMIEFVSADMAEIDAKHFELPAPVVSASEFLSALSPEAGAAELAPLP